MISGIFTGTILKLMTISPISHCLMEMLQSKTWPQDFGKGINGQFNLPSRYLQMEMLQEPIFKSLFEVSE